MNMLDWARKEVEIACEREKGNTSFGEWNYRCACYESALKAFESLIGDDHSGMSIGISQNILNRLTDGKPLTPIEDNDDAWKNHIYANYGSIVSYRCKRMSSLFKDIFADGTVVYTDVNRAYKVDIRNPNSSWHSSLIMRVVNEMFPITMPYMPGEPIKVYCEDFLTHISNGDYDTVGMFYAIKTENGRPQRIEINRYFREDSDGEWIEIDKKEYDERYERRIIND